MAAYRFILLQEADAILGNKDPTRVQAAFAAFIKSRGEQAFSRSYRPGRKPVHLYVVFCIPVAEELDMKQAARVSGNKSVELIHVKDLLGITGYLRGGCSPVGMKKLFPTYFDETMQAQEAVYVSAGLRGMQMHVNPQDLQSVVNAEFVPLTMKH